MLIFITLLFCYHSEVSNIVLVDPLVEVLFEEDNGIWSELW